MSRLVRCKKDRTHTRFDRDKGKCSVCESALEAACVTCGEFKTYSHVKRHEDQCTQVVQQPQKRTTFAYWASNWAVNKDGFSCAPRGQLWDGLPQGCPKKHGFRVHKVKDATMKGMEWMDSYDALFARIACDANFELVKVYHSWEEVEEMLKAPAKMLKGIDILVVGNWVHRVALDQDTLDEPLHWLERLRNVEMETGCRIFPPLGYSITFARKELLVRLLERCIQAPVRQIPTMCVVGSREAWKERALAFAKKNAATTMVLKRSISGLKQHVHYVSVKALNSCTLLDVQHQAKGGESLKNLLGWIVQPLMKEFELHNELRLYIVNGKFLWGVSSKFIEGEEMCLFPFAPGRRDSGWNLEAVRAAEQLVAAIALHEVHAARFLRVDMVRCSEGGWYVNELEFFGDAFLHFEVMDDAYEFFPMVVESVKSWMLL